MDEIAQATSAACEPQAAQRPTPGLRDVLKNRNFRLLWLGETISVLGDQFHLIALPWLVPKLTGDALAMGTVLAIAGIPRAIFMLVGGALRKRAAWTARRPDAHGRTAWNQNARATMDSRVFVRIAPYDVSGSVNEIVVPGPGRSSIQMAP